MSDDMWEGLTLDERPPIEAVDQCGDLSPLTDGVYRCTLTRGHDGVHAHDHVDWYCTWEAS